MRNTAITTLPPVKVEAAATALESRANAVTMADLAEAAQKANEIRTKLQKMSGQWDKLKTQGKLLLQMLGDYWNGSYRAVPWYSIAVGVAALGYVFMPADLVPDSLPVLGPVDDGLMLSLATAAVQHQLTDYCKVKGLEPKEYDL
jgi:uncharacterized membrane protein YkvA (DUF1232 family)